MWCKVFWVGIGDLHQELSLWVTRLQEAVILYRLPLWICLHFYFMVKIWGFSVQLCRSWEAESLMPIFVAGLTFVGKLDYSRLMLCEEFPWLFFVNKLQPEFCWRSNPRKKYVTDTNMWQIGFQGAMNNLLFTHVHGFLICIFLMCLYDLSSGQSSRRCELEFQ